MEPIKLTVPAKLATPERWRAALARAIGSGLSLYQIAATGETVVTSRRNPGLLYRTDGVTCDCEAGQLGGDPVCQHRALYWHDVAGGIMSAPIDTVPVTCPSCHGTGEDWGIGFDGMAVEMACPVCGGRGSSDEPAGTWHEGYDIAA